MRIVASVSIGQPASQVLAYMADYSNDSSWCAGVTQMRPSQPGPAQEGVTTHELLPLLGMTFRTDTTIDRVEPGRLLQWRAPDRQKQLHGSRLVEPTGPASCRFTKVVEGHLLGPSRVLEPLVAWLLQQQATSDLGRLKHLLETSTVSGSAPPVPTHWPPWSRHRRVLHHGQSTTALKEPNSMRTSEAPVHAAIATMTTMRMAAIQIHV
jgi:hypothetical protein